MAGETLERRLAECAAENETLRRALKTALYERDFLQQRLNQIRTSKETLVSLLDTPTLQEYIEEAEQQPYIIRKF